MSEVQSFPAYLSTLSAVHLCLPVHRLDLKSFRLATVVVQSATTAAQCTSTVALKINAPWTLESLRGRCRSHAASHRYLTVLYLTSLQVHVPRFVDMVQPGDQVSAYPRAMRSHSEPPAKLSKHLIGLAAIAR